MLACTINNKSLVPGIGPDRQDAEAQAHYENLQQAKPAALASLLNLTTAMKAIQLPSKTPLDYFKEILWDESLAQDRFFAYADKSIVDQVRRAAMEHEFAPEPNPGLFHPDATSSFKQIQFGEANVQLTFHEKTPRRSTEWSASRSNRTSITTKTSALTHYWKSSPIRSPTA